MNFAQRAMKYWLNKNNVKAVNQRSMSMSNTKSNQTINLNNEERQRCEVWTRVMGYHRPVSAFNPGKKSEHSERKHFVECAAQH